ncbi:helicase [Oceanobacillus jeddahense]|uniref:Helicase n=1 Tax=Oceanobacillus jeddahense TaxID=1462527 RepID=A0ABY5JTC4_9BACI|nr:helicase [Oceanobacillus jeddahense]UUI03590.1 helicase [Oceanobacillus jeddahense]
MIENEKLYSNGNENIRIIKIGGHTKTELIQKMNTNKIFLNELAEKLIASDYLEISKEPYMVKVIELTVKDLGFSEGAVTSQLFSKAAKLELELCPLELALYLRLAYLNQTEGYNENQLQNQAPYGSITIASKIFSKDVNFPKGFYLRKIQGDLWLRGYVADEAHVWNSHDRFVFCVTKQ